MIRSFTVVLFVMATLLIPGAAAVRGELAFDADEGYRVDGSAEVRFPFARMNVWPADIEGTIVFEQVTGVLRSITGKDAFLGPDSNPIPVPQEGPDIESRDVTNATLVFVLDRETLAGSIASLGEGCICIRANVSGEVKHHWRRTDSSTTADDPNDQRVDVTWKAGWGILNADLMPTPQGADFDLTGAFEFRFDRAGNFSLDGEESRRIGRWDVREPGDPEGPGLRHTRYERLYFKGTIGSSSLHLPSGWSLAGPSIAWHVDGNVDWVNAAGTGEVDGAAVQFTDGTIAAAGVTAIALTRTGTTGADVDTVRFRANGNWSRLQIDDDVFSNAQVARPLAANPYMVPTLAAVVVALVLATGKIITFLYTRIAPGAVLKNPRRKLVFEIVTAEPGIHKRDLQRRIGCAWGVLNFHVRMLRETGHVRTETRGLYTLVYPVGVADAVGSGGTDIPHPVARAIYQAIPVGSDPIPFADLRDRTGISRQLLNYHLRMLKRHGMIEDVNQGKARAVSRVVAASPRARS